MRDDTDAACCTVEDRDILAELFDLGRVMSLEASSDNLAVRLAVDDVGLRRSSLRIDASSGPTSFCTFERPRFAAVACIDDSEVSEAILRERGGLLE